jgi:hypothetical protein
MIVRYAINLFTCAYIPGSKVNNLELVGSKSMNSWTTSKSADSGSSEQKYKQDPNKCPIEATDPWTIILSWPGLFAFGNIYLTKSSVFRNFISSKLRLLVIVNYPPLPEIANNILKLKNKLPWFI